jgi:hypothetical protein
MHPTYPVSNSPISELGLYDIFRKKLNNDFYVFHSVSYILTDKYRVKEGEIDFLILHANLGILVLEVKGGREINYIGEKKQWYSIDFNGVSHQIKDPYLQGRKQSHEIMKHLHLLSIPGFYSKAIPFGHAVIFPNAVPYFGHLPSHAKDWMTITSKDMDVFDTKIHSIMSRWGKGKSFEGITPKIFRRLINQAFTPVFKLVYAIGDQIRDQDKIIWKMTRQQCLLLDFISQHKRACVQGYAGTGKTVLAREKARRAALQGKKVLMLCYNSPLRGHLATSISEFDGDITVNNFHGICRDFIIESGQEFLPPEENAHSFWEDDVPLMMLQALESIIERFDTIIVDEAQDFCSSWWTVVEELLFSKKSGELYIFSDPQQDLFRRSSNYPVETEPFILIQNCRNTREITKLISKIIGKKLTNPENHPEGMPIVIKRYKTREEELGIVDGLLKKLVTKEKILPSGIVFLSHYQRANTCLSDTQSLQDLKIIDNPHPGGDNQVRFSTVHRFKGLEANVAILIDVDEHAAQDAVTQYVATSRAKHLLYAFVKEGVSTAYG